VTPSIFDMTMETDLPSPPVSIDSTDGKYSDKLLGMFLYLFYL
jgi:hypothetical protein